MKKKLLALLFSLVFCFLLAVPAVSAQSDGFESEYARVQDLADLLTDSEENALTDKLDRLCPKLKMDIVIMTADTLDGQSIVAYADDTFDYGGFGYGEDKDGLLLLISMEDRNWYISTHGYGITAFTDAGIQYIGQEMKEDLSTGNYAAAFDTFTMLCNEFVLKARAGNPYDTHNLPREPLSLIWIPISIAVGTALSFLIVGSMKAKLKTVRFQAAASSYIKEGSLNITESRDMFLYHTVTRTERQKSSSSSGGSSTHTSSSGETHGGGGGSF